MADEVAARSGASPSYNSSFQMIGCLFPHHDPDPVEKVIEKITRRSIAQYYSVPTAHCPKHVLCLLRTAVTLISETALWPSAKTSGA
jgi:hypothetical protein